MITNPTNSLEWIIYLAQHYSGMFIQGTLLTLYIAVIGTLLGFLLGYGAGIVQDIRIRPADHALKKAGLRVLKAIFTVYVEIFRDTPMMVQAMVVYYGILQAGFDISPIAAGILVTVLNTGAYMAETVRAGINSVDLGQREGALAMGMSPLKTMFYIILPQVLRNILPEMGNTFLTTLKMTSVLNVLAINELYMAAKTAGSVNYKYFQSFLLTAVIYFVLCFAFSRIFRLMEKHLEGKKDYVLAVEYMDAQ